ncbi:calcium-binding protein [Nocardioides sp. CN2-186]|uniref:calcium-binding protein n=1 Tax=Nocardioides tweenelious TaxID=3156607 RepID=UPI0032B3747C
MLTRLGAFVLLAATTVAVPAAHAAAVPHCHGHAATIVGTPGRDHLTGTPGDDVIVAGRGDDRVDAGDGDDIVCGGDGADTLRGGPGDDRLYGQRDARHSDRGGTYFVSDVLGGGPGDDRLAVGSDDRWVEYGSYGVVDFRRAQTGVTVDLAAGTATGEGSDTIVLPPRPCPADGCYPLAVEGSAHDDVISGTSAADYLVGNDGDDRVVGLGGADDLVADRESGRHTSGDDTVLGGPGRDFLQAFAGTDDLEGGPGDDTVWQTGGGPSEVSGGDGDDEVVVWFPAEPGFVLDGGPGDDTGQVLGPERPGAGGRPLDATFDGRAETVHSGDDTFWGRVLGVEDLYLGAAVTWTCENRAGIHVQGCTRPSVVE